MSDGRIASRKRYTPCVGMFPVREEYIARMSHSKWSVGDTSSRDYATAKYFEMGACQNALIGDKPLGYDDLFVHEETMIEIPRMDIEEVFVPKLLKYVTDDETGKDISQKYHDRIVRNYTIDKIGKRYEKMYLEVIG